jgi:hemin uptake protein HemP
MNARPEPFVTPWLTTDATPSHEARVLTEGGSLARIALDGQVYTLRITRQGKLIPTK